VITETVVDGVPTLLAPKAGPMAAGLLFRVGRADETLATSGITHLAEHLALHRLGLGDYHFNGATAALYTHFHVQGSAADVVDYFGSVCDGLANLPMARLETEKAILRTEANGRGRNPLPLWRYGAAGYGLVSYPEWGLYNVDEATLRHWVDTWFTAENAVLWVAGGDVPAELRLRLPSGTRRPVPQATSALPTTPAYFAESGGEVVLHSVVRRRVAGSVYAGLLERELYRQLRQEGGYSYTATASYDGRDAQYATVVAVADSAPDMRSATVGGFIDVLAQLRAGRFSDSDIAAVVAKSDEMFDHPELDAARLTSCAMNVLIGYPYLTREQLRWELQAVTPSAVHEVALEVSANALLKVPPGASPEWAGFAAAPIWSRTAVTGKAYAATETDGTSQLVIGPDGVTIARPGGPVTVRFADCQTMLAWADGGRQLIGSDGIVVPVEPTLWKVDTAALREIDARVSRSVTVYLPARDASAIPIPSVAQPTAPAVRRAGRGARVVASIVLSILSVILLILAGAVAQDIHDLGGTPQERDGAPGALVVLVGLFALLTFIGFRYYRRTFRRGHGTT
jgi:predicted Zn-dependent peptidase